jgi:hypothetical protein
MNEKGKCNGIGPGQCGVSHERIRIPAEGQKEKPEEQGKKEKRVDIEDNGSNTCIYYVIIE